MASINYFSGRKRYGRPQAMLFSDNPGTLHVLNAGTENEQKFYLPDGFEVGTSQLNITDPELIDQFLILSDDNRSEIKFDTERIEKRQRMINGRMRSYHIADKLKINVSWDMLPSRAFKTFAGFNPDDGVASLVSAVDHDNSQATIDKRVKPYGSAYYDDQQYTTDGGAGGVELLKWYENHPGSFWVFLSYDKYSAFENLPFNNLNKYSQVVEVFFDDFSYSVVKRGRSNHDFWNVSLTLEEV
jgi:hypothetical protein